MNKFRARQLDATKPIGIFYEGDNPEIVELNNATNRNVPQLPTGMEKDEETEHHLQQAIYHQRVIPVPEVYDTSESNKVVYDSLYPPDYKIPKLLIHIHPFELRNDLPDYDVDSEDEAWLKGRGLDVLQFEEMMDRFEKASGLSACTLNEAKLLLQDDDDVVTSVYDYWLNKRLSLEHSLVPQVKTVNCVLQVKTEKCIGSSPTDPYVAFRKRTEKMQTRKNRKNDESSYEKMLKLKRDLVKAFKLIELAKRREEQKRNLVKLNKEIFGKRYSMEDYTGSVVKEIIASRPRVVMPPSVVNHRTDQEDSLWRKYNNTKRRKETKERRPYKKKRKLDNLTIPKQNAYSDTFASTYVPLESSQNMLIASEDELASHSEAEEDSPFDPFTFTRKANVTYLAPKDPLSKTQDFWSGPSCRSSSSSDPINSRSSKNYYLTSKSKKCVGFMRRRIGRGGRVWLDRIALPSNDPIDNFNNEYPEDSTEFPKEWPHYEMRSPVESATCVDTPETPALPSMFYITAEVLDGCNSGSLSQLEVASGTECEKSEVDSTASTSRFCTRGANPQGQIVVKCVDPEGTNSCSTYVNSSRSSSPHGTKSPASSSSKMSPKSPSINSSSATTTTAPIRSVTSLAPPSRSVPSPASSNWRSASSVATPTCTLTPSSLSTTTVSVSSLNSLPYSRFSINKNSSVLNSSSDSKNNIFINRPSANSSVVPDVHVNNSVLNNSSDIVNSTPHPTKIYTWNNDTTSAKAGTSLINGPSSKLPQKIVYSDTENL